MRSAYRANGRCCVASFASVSQALLLTDAHCTPPQHLVNGKPELVGVGDGPTVSTKLALRPRQVASQATTMQGQRKMRKILSGGARLGMPELRNALRQRYQGRMQSRHLGDIAKDVTSGALSGSEENRRPSYTVSDQHR